MNEGIFNSFSIFILIVACFCTSNAHSSEKIVDPHHHVNHRVLVKNTALNLTKKVRRSYSKWRGVKYKFGGTRRSGIDCSAYTRQIIGNIFNIYLPRTARAQMTRGKKVAFNKLRAGDLVFFRTGRSSMHVGVYVHNGNFTHASTTAGVTITNLDNPYWSSRLIAARRIQ